MSFADGVYGQLVDDATRMHGGHFTLEHPDYRDAPAVDLFVEGVAQKRAQLEKIPGVVGTKAAVLAQGVLKSAAGALGVSVMGVEPAKEAATSPIAKRLVAGSYLESGDRRKVVIGVKLAERLKVKVGKKLVVTTNNASGELVEELLRVKGIFAIGADEVDAYFVQVPLNTGAQGLRYRWGCRNPGWSFARRSRPTR